MFMSNHFKVDRKIPKYVQWSSQVVVVVFLLLFFVVVFCLFVLSRRRFIYRSNFIL